MDDRVGPQAREQLAQRRVVGHVAVYEIDRGAAAPVPGGEPFLDRTNRRERRDPEFAVPAAADEVVDDRYVVSDRCQMKSARPTAVAVAANHEDTNEVPSLPGWETKLEDARRVGRGRIPGRLLARPNRQFLPTFVIRDLDDGSR